MALLFFEGFETVGTETGLANQSTTRPRIHKRWDNTGSGGIPATDSYFLIDDNFSEGYAICMGTSSFSNGNYLEWDVPASYNGVNGSATTFVVGARVHIPAGTTRDFPWLSIRTTNPAVANSLQFYVIDSADVQAYNPQFGVGEIGRSNGAVNADDWHYLECKFIIAESASSGFVEVRVDGQEVINETGVDTNNNFGTAVLDFRFGCTNASTGTGDYVGYDDIYILVDADGGQTDYLDPQRIRALPPTGDTGTMDWTTSSGTVHYTLIDENGVDTSDYVESGTATDIDMFSLTNIDDSRLGVYHGVKVEAEAIISDSGSGTLDVRIDSNGTVSETNSTISSTTTYVVVNHIDDKDPSGGANFTQSRLDALKAGIEKNS